MEISDLEIVQLLQNGDKRAMELIYDKWGAALFGVILKVCKDEISSEDILQDVMINVWNNAGSYDPEKSKVFTWIYRIAVNKSIDVLRRATKNRTISIEDELHSDSELSYSSYAFAEGRELSAHINALEPKYRNIIKALFYEGYTQKECSENLNLPIGTVKSRLRIALRELRKVYHDLPISLLIIISLYGS